VAAANDDSLDGLVVPIEPIAPDDLCVDAHDLFLQDPRLHAIPVVDARDRPVGLLNRFRVLEGFSQRFGHELWARRRVHDVMERHPLIVDHNTTLDDLSTMIAEDDGQYMFDGFIVTRDGVYAGVGTAHRLMRRLSERRQAYLYHLAHHDALTGLANRSLFDDRVAQALKAAERASRRVALLFVDLDRFKAVNDTLGHAFGDLLLKATADRITAVVRRGDTVARLGGDEFAIVLPEVTQDNAPGLVAAKIQAAMSAPFVLEDQEVHVSCSIGVAVHPDDAGGRQALLRAADAAVYHAKQLRNTWQRYSSDMARPMLQGVWTFSALKRAIDGGELEVFYQPQVALDTNKIVGLEALVRWRHPIQGILPAADLIALAEDTGLIVLLGEEVLRAAMRQMRVWDEQFCSERLMLAVNISGVQIREGSVVTMLRRLLEETGFDPTRLELEITETTAMRSASSSQAALLQLKAMGVRLAVDDFGTGYSSLSQLERMPVDTLKIDRTFLAGSEDPAAARTIAGGGALAKAVILIARSLGLRVAAEGVEQPEQLDFLKEHGCDLAQGYLFSPPLCAADTTEFLAARGFEYSGRPSYPSL
jgi:diguanylate cyclase (GGDEF)-like protein